MHGWFLDPLGQHVVIGLGLGTATLLLIKSPLGEASGAHMNPAITLTFFYLGKIRLVDLCIYIIAQVAGVFATLFVLSRLLPEPVTHLAVNYLISMSGSAGELAAFAGEFLIAFLLMAALLWINNTPYWARHTPCCFALLSWAAFCLAFRMVSCASRSISSGLRRLQSLGSNFLGCFFGHPCPWVLSIPHEINCCKHCRLLGLIVKPGPMR